MDQKKSKLAQIWLISVVIIIILLLAVCLGYYFWATTYCCSVEINTNSNVSQIEETKEVVEAATPEQSFIAYLQVRNGDQVEIYHVDQDGNTALIKSYDRDLGESIALTNLLTGPQVYISGIGQDGYTVLDYTGQDISADYSYLKKKNFDISNYVIVPGYKRLVYSLAPGEEQLEGKPLIVAAYDHSTIDYIETDVLPNGINSSRPVGWSKDEQDLYVTKIGWEGFELADLWKVNFSSKEVTHIENADKLVLGGLNVNPSLDLAVGIEVTEIECDECMGPIGPGVPSSLYLFDLKNNTSQKLIADSPVLMYDPIISPDGQKIFYSDDAATYMMDIDGSNVEKLGEDVSLEALSNDNQILIIKSQEKYILKNLTDQTETEINVDSINDDSYADFIQCNYPLRFNCLY